MLKPDSLFLGSLAFSWNVFVLEVCSAVGADIGVGIVLSAAVLAVDFLVDGLEPLNDLAG